MNMAREVPDIERLIEEGLTRYGQGDLDGALEIWERVLAVDPAHPQATSYVDYVRMNYEVLTAEAGDEDKAPFGISDDEPEYQIEILPGDVQAAAAPPMYMDPLDEGWFLDDSDGHHGPYDEDGSQSSEAMTLELEADEPPADEAPALPSGSDSGEVSFEDATREYQAGARRPNPSDVLGPDPVTTEFRPEGTPAFDGPEEVTTGSGLFSLEVTEYRKRDLGFVKATRDLESAPPEETSSGPPRPAAPPELKMTLRTPTREHIEGRSPPSPGIEAALPPIELDAEPPPPSPGASAQSSAGPGSADDLIASLPSPKPAHSFAPTRELPKAVTLAMPQDVAGMSSAPTRDLGEQPGISFAKATTQDFADKPTQEVQPRGPLDPLVSAPTRELGLRPGRAPTEDEPTIAEIRLGREQIAELDKEGTRADAVMPFDPMDARSAQILDEIDEGAPAEESRDDHTRRRITTLLERASEWSRADDHERAVAAVDLALSEDPNSALAQKLIHRNRETIQSVFQLFLGALERQPTLARPLHELASAPISPRAAFLLSRVDGMISLDEILDVSGMPRLEALRYLCQLFLRGILR